jgi:nucleoside-diphosphate-sugar epimerase
MSLPAALIGPTEQWGRTPTSLVIAGRDFQSGMSLQGAAVALVAEPYLPGPLTRLRRRHRARALTSEYASLAKAAHDSGAEKLIVCSTAFLYGDDGGWLHDEASPVEPKAETIAAFAAEQAAGIFTSLGGQSVVLRFGWVFGDNDPISAQIVGAAQKGWRLIDGQPGSWVSSISQSDTVAALRQAVAVPAGIYNISNGRPVTQALINVALEEALGQRLHPLYDPYWGEKSTFFGASRQLVGDKFGRLTGWEPVGPGLLAHLSGHAPSG